MGEQALLLRHATGAFLSEAAKSIWAEDTDGNCPLCGQLQTKHHKILACPSLKSVRAPLQPNLQRIIDDWPSWVHCPAPSYAPDVEIAQLIFHTRQLPVPTVHFAAWDVPGARGFLRLFTDGSCRYPASSSARHAGFAVVLDATSSDAEVPGALSEWRVTGVPPLTFAVAWSQESKPSTVLSSAVSYKPFVRLGTRASMLLRSGLTASMSSILGTIAPAVWLPPTRTWFASCTTSELTLYSCERLNRTLTCASCGVWSSGCLLAMQWWIQLLARLSRMICHWFVTSWTAPCITRLSNLQTCVSSGGSYRTCPRKNTGFCGAALPLQLRTKSGRAAHFTMRRHISYLAPPQCRPFSMQTATRPGKGCLAGVLLATLVHHTHLAMDTKLTVECRA